MLFGVGFYAGPGLLRNRIAIPIQDAQGRLVAYCGRSLDGSEPRYKFPPGFAKAHVLYNFHRAADGDSPGVIVVEGFFDCLKVQQAGFGSVVALMGAAFSAAQRQLLTSRFQHVTVMLDGDEAGRRASAQIADRLASVCSVRVIALGDGVQPDQLSAEVICRILAEKGGSDRE